MKIFTDNNPMEEIIAKIGDTVKIDKIIKPIYNYKNSKG